jgi:N-terminal acetyltransferase B complex non-catalytic subunit
LILLAVQQLLWQDENPHTLFTSAVLLEWALSKSPYNANLKLQAMDVYAALQATTRCWELFRDLSIKHIQVDSCTYLILPYLLDGGLFDEVIDVCRDIVRLHVSMVRDTAEYSTRAMEHGTLYKAQEFWTFQRERMTNSLSALQAKGLIFDAAPLLAVHQTSSSSGKGRGDDDSSSKEGKLYGSLGANHGIVGGESDLERAIQMIHELHNPFGAPRLVNMVASSSNADPSDDYSDNRDRGILAFQILHRRSNIPSKKEIVNSTFRRGHIHGLLIRAVLVMDATKGPKKGKLVKSSVQLEKRCSSLLQAVDSASQFIERWENEDSNERQHPALLSLVQSLFLVCRLVVVASAGLPDAPAQETMDRREARVTEMINLLLSQLTKAKTCLEESGSLSFPDCCRLLVDVLASLFALFKMASTILNVFGWGKRKCKTRPSAAAMAQAAAVFADVVKILYQSVDKRYDKREKRIINSTGGDVNDIF